MSEGLEQESKKLGKEQSGEEEAMKINDIGKSDKVLDMGICDENWLMGCQGMEVTEVASILINEVMVSDNMAHYNC